VSLAAIVRDLEAAQRRLHELVAATPGDRWARRASPESWSVSECVSHLNLTSKAYIPLLRDAFAEAKVAGLPAPQRYRRDFMGWLVSVFAGPLPRIGRRRLGRAKTIPRFVPGGELDRATVVAEFDALQRQLVELARGAEGRPLEQMRIASPFDSRVSYNAYSALVILPRHQQRHLWQAEHVWDGY
jgi:hypothetical protein